MQLLLRFMVNSDFFFFEVSSVVDLISQGFSKYLVFDLRWLVIEIFEWNLKMIFAMCRYFEEFGYLNLNIWSMYMYRVILKKTFIILLLRVRTTSLLRIIWENDLPFLRNILGAELALWGWLEVSVVLGLYKFFGGPIVRGFI